MTVKLCRNPTAFVPTTFARLVGLVGWVALAGAACSNNAGMGQPSAANLYSSKITAVDIEVDYGKGAEPYAGVFAGINLWDLFKTNATRLLNAGNKAKSLTVPTTLGAMQELPEVNGSSYTNEQIIEIAKAHRDLPNTSTRASFYVLFLPGYLNDHGTQKTDVLGLSFAGTGVIAMFKPVIESAVTGPTAVLVEQSTLIHEFGHAVGLVNNGIPLQTQHEDSAHSAHCSSSSCVMYYANEGTVFARAFIDSITSDSSVLFDAACLADVDAFAAAQN